MRSPEAIVHQDSTGGANQTLRDLAAGEGGGFAVVWQDQRDGMLSVEMRRIAASGAPLEREQPIHDCAAGRTIDPVVAIAPDGSGAVAWIAARSHLEPRVWMRAFDQHGRFLAPAKPVEVARPRTPPGAGRAKGAAHPVIVRRREGGYAIAWVETGGVRMLEVDASGVWRDRPGSVTAPGPKPAIAVELGASRDGGVLCAQTSGDGWIATVFGRSAESSRAGAPSPGLGLGAGELERFEADLFGPSGGFWSWFRTQEGYELRHLDGRGDLDRSVLRPLATVAGGTGAERRTDFAAWRGGIAVLVSDESEGLLLHLLDADGKPLDPAPIQVFPAGSAPAADGRIASNGKVLYVAWTDRRNGDPDVYGRAIDPGAPAERRLGPEFRLNSDDASSDQIRPSLAAAGSRAVVAWQDHREGRARVLARRTEAGSVEFRLPVGRTPVPESTQTRPAVAMLDTGEFLAAWTEGVEGDLGVRAQVFRPGAGPPGSPTSLGPDVLLHEVAREPSRIALAALPARRGFLAVFEVPGEGEVRAARIGVEGEVLSAPSRIGGGNGDVLCDAALTVLEDGRALACWSRQSKNKVWTIVARSLDLDGSPLGEEIGIEPTARGMDWEPALAPAPDGGFLLAWTAGTREAAVRGEEWRDVVARSFDSEARPRGPLLAISPLHGEQDHPRSSASRTAPGPSPGKTTSPAATRSTCAGS